MGASDENFEELSFSTVFKDSSAHSAEFPTGILDLKAASEDKQVEEVLSAGFIEDSNSGDHKPECLEGNKTLGLESPRVFSADNEVVLEVRSGEDYNSLSFKPLFGSTVSSEETKTGGSAKFPARAPKLWGPGSFCSNSISPRRCQTTEQSLPSPPKVSTKASPGRFPSSGRSPPNIVPSEALERFYESIAESRCDLTLKDIVKKPGVEGIGAANIGKNSNGQRSQNRVHHLLTTGSSSATGPVANTVAAPIPQSKSPSVPQARLQSAKIEVAVSNDCAGCSSSNLWLKTRCLVCGRLYCTKCVKDAMGTMPEGRKCKTCLGHPFNKRFKDKVGRGCWPFGMSTALKEIEKQQWARRRHARPKRNRVGA